MHRSDGQGRLFVISGPSGVGKGTLVSKLKEERPDVWVSVSATTRKPREGEVNGKDYFFLDRDDFEKKIEEDGFVEWAEYSGNLYGTPISAISEKLASGINVILEIEVQGALQVRDKFPDATLIFVEPPSLEELRRRIVGRGTESDEAIEMRMRTAELELERKMEYDIALVNDDVDIALSKLQDIIDE